VPPPGTATPPPAAQIAVTPPGTEFRVGGGPYTVPITVSGASRVSMVSLTLNYNTSVLRVRAVQEGSFLRQGNATVAFAQNVDAATGRVDITLTRAGDLTGASGAGLLAAILFDTVGTGNATITASGVATAPGGANLPLQFTPASVVVR
jgi:hypothetical protein